MHCKGSPLLTRIYDICNFFFSANLSSRCLTLKAFILNNGLINRNDNKFVAKAFRTIYFEYYNSVVEIDNLPTFLKLNFNSKFIDYFSFKHMRKT